MWSSIFPKSNPAASHRRQVIPEPSSCEPNRTKECERDRIIANGQRRSVLHVSTNFSRPPNNNNSTSLEPNPSTPRPNTYSPIINHPFGSASPMTIGAGSSSITPIISAIANHEEQDPVQQVYSQLAQLNQRLFDADIVTHLSLQQLLQQKFGIGAQLSVDEMKDIRSRVAAINSSYSEFSQSIKEAVILRLGDQDETKISVSESEGPTKSSVESISQRHDDYHYPAHAKQKHIIDADDSINMKEGASDNHTLNSVLPLKLRSLSQDINKISLDSLSRQPSAADLSIDKTTLDGHYANALKFHEQIIKQISDIKDIINGRRSSLNPQAIINAQTDQGQLQSFFVHLKYKEMVQGCIDSRNKVDSCYAGSDMPGDYWFNDLLKAFWRTYDPPMSDRLEKSKRDLNHESRDQVETTLKCRSELTLVSNSQRHRTFDSIHAEELISWIETVTEHPDWFDSWTLQAVELVHHKFGGRRHYLWFFRDWLRQFYLDHGKVGLVFPLPGCSAYSPRTDYSVQNSERFSTLKLQRTIASRTSVGTSGSSGLNSSHSNFNLEYKDLRRAFSDFCLLSTLRDVLSLQEILDREFPTGPSCIDRWLSAVKQSGILSAGSYALKIGDTVDSKDLSLTDSSLVYIREKAIVISAYLKPDRVLYLKRIQTELQRALEQQKPTAEHKTFPEHLPKQNTQPPASGNRRGHKKSSSTGFFETLISRRKRQGT